eukprot:351201-Chlamydomonas_euryale.AAC.3
MLHTKCSTPSARPQKQNPKFKSHSTLSLALPRHGRGPFPGTGPAQARALPRRGPCPGAAPAQARALPRRGPCPGASPAQARALPRRRPCPSTGPAQARALPWRKPCPSTGALTAQGAAQAAAAAAPAAGIAPAPSQWRRVACGRHGRGRGRWCRLSGRTCFAFSEALR